VPAASVNSPVRNAASVNASSAVTHNWDAVGPDSIVTDDEYSRPLKAGAS